MLGLFVLLPQATSAQTVDSLLYESETPVSTGPPRVFLDCDRCDETYIRREIPFVDYVRDRKDSDIHLLVTQQRTGSGGLEYVLNYIGQKRHFGTDQRLVYTSPTGVTRDERRAGLVERMKIGLVPYVSATPIGSHLTVSYSEPDEPVSETTVDDLWNSWVFEIQGDASLDGEATQRSVFLSGSFAADRVTEKWKVESRLYVSQRQRRFEQDEEVIESEMSYRNAEASVVYSLADRWSSGLFGSIYSSTYQNIDLSAGLAPALEFSVFPYEQSSRRELTLVYRIGVQSMDYIEQTIFGEASQLLSNESLTGRLRFVQPWGTVFVHLEGSHYLHDPSKNRLELYNNVSVRLFRGLSMRISGRLEIIHDQLYLAAGEGSLEDLLLQQRQLATTYDYGVSFGLSYTFGSIYSNVVNTRL